MKQTLIIYLSILAIIVVALSGCYNQASSKEQPPNILFFFVEDIGWQETSVPFYKDMTELNRRYHTPNMEMLADQGMKFTQAYAAAVCSPSRVSLMTGMNMGRHRVTNWTLRKGQSPDPEDSDIKPLKWNVNGLASTEGTPRTVAVQTLPTLLQQAGYTIIHVGKAHFEAMGTPGAERAITHTPAISFPIARSGRGRGN